MDTKLNWAIAAIVVTIFFVLGLMFGQYKEAKDIYDLCKKTGEWSHEYINKDNQLISYKIKCEAL